MNVKGDGTKYPFLKSRCDHESAVLPYGDNGDGQCKFCGKMFKGIYTTFNNVIKWIA